MTNLIFKRNDIDGLKRISNPSTVVLRWMSDHPFWMKMIVVRLKVFKRQSFLTFGDRFCDDTELAPHQVIGGSGYTLESVMTRSCEIKCVEPKRKQERTFQTYSLNMKLIGTRPYWNSH